MENMTYNYHKSLALLTLKDTQEHIDGMELVRREMEILMLEHGVDVERYKVYLSVRAHIGELRELLNYYEN